ncbi:MAG: hypothetical protein ABSA67_11635 [Candidatus Brocadiia bacterium]
MNARHLLKLVVVLAVLLFMVMMGMSNGDPVRFKILSYTSDPIKSAFMYFTFFAVGAFTGLVLAVGTGGGHSSASKGK